MEQSNEYKQLYRNYVVQGSEELHPVSERFMQDASNCINVGIIPQEVTLPELKPVRNFSIQTGEEFALEFMRDRVLPHRPIVQRAFGDPGHSTGYVDLRGNLGVSRVESDTVSDVSMVSLVESKEPKDLGKNNSSFCEEKTNYGSMLPTQQSLSSHDTRGTLCAYASSSTSDSLSVKIKILCSFGGKILPRPSDGKLRYVGGETRILRINKDISWKELQQKTLAIFNEAHTIKYQLPGEDLDALVSVSSDEDLQNMMEECYVHGDVDGSRRLRIFLFTSRDMDDTYSFTSGDADSAIQYVVSINGMEIESTKNSVLNDLETSSVNNSEQLTVQNAEKDLVGTVGSAYTSFSPSTRNPALQLTLQSSKSVSPGLSDNDQIHQQLLQAQMTAAEEAVGYRFHQESDFHPSSGTPSDESLITAPQATLIDQSMMAEPHLCGDSKINNSLTVAKQVKVIDDSSVLETQFEKVQAARNDSQVSLEPCDGNMLDTSHVEKALPPSVSTGPLKEMSGRLPPKGERKYHGSNLGPSPSESGSLSNGLNADADSSLMYNKAVFTEPDAYGMSSFEPSLPPQRVYSSERFPREQAGLLNRLSKSDDSLNSQYIITHSRSDVGRQDSVAEPSDNLQHGNPIFQHGLPFPARYPLLEDSQMMDEGAISKGPKLLGDVAQLDTKLVDFYPGGKNDTVTESELTEGNSVTTTIQNEEKQNLAKQFFGSNPSVLDEDKPAEDAHLDSSSTLPEASWGGTSGQNSATTAGVPGQEQGDILIDINDRFPRDFLTDMFSKAIMAEESSGIIPLQQDGAGLSMNVENYDPKHWSFFQKLAKNDFGENVVSLMDQDHPGFPSGLAIVDEEASGTYKLTSLASDRVTATNVGDSHITYDEYKQRELIGLVGTDQGLSLSDYNPSQLQYTDTNQFDAIIENLRSPFFGYEVGKQDFKNAGLPPLDQNLVDFDINSLQIIRNDDLEELRELGSGTFGTVYHGKWRGTDVAIKRIKKSCFTGRSSEQERLTLEFWREAEILSKLHHPNVVAFYGVVQDGPGGTLATVTEYMVDGSLRHVLLRKDRQLDRRKRIIIAMDAAFGMEYLHSKNIVHFDLKCDNLLVNLKDPSRPICKVGDFGLSKIKRNTLVSGGVRGTLPWMAPELLNGSSNKVSEKVDVFSFGIVLWEILTGEEPYANMHYGAIIGGIVNNTLRPPLPSTCDPEWRRLMEQCWAPNPASRPSFTEIAAQLRLMASACQTRGQVSRTPH
ncbi:putative serine/threonine-protein kinase SIS8 [Drosera capensis]